MTAQAQLLTRLAAWTGGTAAIAFGFGQMADSPPYGVSTAILIFIAGGLLYYAIERASGNWRIVGGVGAAVLVFLALGVVSASGDSGNPDDDSAARPTRPTTSSSPTESPSSTSVTSTSPTTTPPAPINPLLPPEERVLYPGKAAEFFGGALLLGPQNVYSNDVVLTITTEALECRPTTIDMGRRFLVEGNTTSNRYFRVTVLETKKDESALVRAEDVPPEGWPTHDPGCPSIIY